MKCAQKILLHINRGIKCDKVYVRACVCSPCLGAQEVEWQVGTNFRNQCTEFYMPVLVRPTASRAHCVGCVCVCGWVCVWGVVRRVCGSGGLGVLIRKGRKGGCEK